MNSSRWRIIAASLALVASIAFVLRYPSQLRDGDVRPAAPGEPTLVRADGQPAAPALLDPAICAPTGVGPGSTRFADAVIARTRREEALNRVAAFGHWLTEWRRADAAEQPALVAAGKDLAVARRAALKQLIETDPRRALEVAVPVGLRAELPADVQAQLEQRIDSRGTLEVSIAHAGNEARIDRTAIIGEDRYRAFAFGRREHQQTKIGLPLHGIAIDDRLALDETPYRILDDAEKSARGTPADLVAVAIGAEVRTLARPAKFETVAKDLVAAESQVGPHVVLESSGSPDPGATMPETAAVTSLPSWINGPKRVLWVRVDFADDPGMIATEAEIAVSSAAVADYYASVSQGKTTMTFAVLPAVLRLPKDKSYYNTSMSTSGELQEAASVLAKAYDAANGSSGTWDPDRYDRWLVVFPRIPSYTFGGQAITGGARVRMNGTISPATASHELGHNQSLGHAYYWLPAGNLGSGPGAHIEYGDVFDLMGGGGTFPINHFNVSQKAKLGYLDSAAITTVTQAGTYRIARHDHKDSAGIRALKIAPADLGYEYWLEHRRLGPTNLSAAQLDRLRNGVLLHWGPEKAPKFTSGLAGSYLIDATPGSAGGASDAPLRIGESFVDPDAGVTIKPLAVGGAAPNEYIDVQVFFGAIDGNRNPIVSANLPSGAITARSNVVFTASGSDPDGDSIYYRWDFGDGSLQPNLNSITQRFAKGGSYSLRVSAHDGKGGIAAQTLALNVVDPLLTWALRPSGATSILNDVIFAGGQFIAAGAGFVVTSPDSTTWTRRDAINNNYNWLGLAHSGTRYVVVGSRNSTTEPAGAAYSEDGAVWTLATVPTGAGQFRAATYGAGRFVAVGNAGRIYNSNDGAAWTAVASPVSNNLRAIVYGDNLFVATGESGRVVTSPDGVVWTNRSVSTGNTLIGLTRHKGAWFASSSTVEGFTSPNGVTWTRVATAGRTNNTNRLISTGGVLFTTTANGSIAFTEDPRSWTQYQIEPAANTGINGAAEGNGQLVIVASRGLVYTTPVPLASPVLPAPSLRLEADSLKVAVGKKNVLAVTGSGFAKIELYANGTKVSEMNGTAGALAWTPPVVGNYSLVVRGIDANGVSVVSSSYPAVAGLTRWRTRNPQPAATDLRGAVRANDKWWIVGGVGTFLTLDNGGNFTVLDFPTTQQLNSIGYANGRFVVVAPDLDNATKEDIGGLWTSTDGYTWTPLLTGILDSLNLNYVTYAGDQWVATGTGGTLLTSTDGITWARQSSGVTTNILGVTFGNGLYVAVTAGGRIITSPNGVAWTVRTSGVTTDLRTVAFNGGTFVAAGAAGVILTSPNGTTWTARTSGTTSSLSTAAFVQSTFVVAGDNGTLVTSSDGATWTVGSMEGKASSALCIAASGDDGILVGRAGEVFTATSAASWKRVNQGTGESRFRVIYGGGRFVSVGQATDAITRASVVPISTSTDGLTWTRAAANDAFGNLNDVTYSQNRYVAVGDNSNVFTSTDAVTWTKRTFNFISTINTVTAGPNLFVIGTAAGIYTSPDGTSWTQRITSLTSANRASVYGNGRYVVVGNNGTIWTSTDGTAWAPATSGTTVALLTVRWWEDVGFLAAGNNGIMITSVDGLTWTPVETGITDNIASIEKTPLGFVASGGVLGTMLVSLDGANWSISSIPADRMIRSLAAGPSMIAAVGDNGAMLAFELTDTTPAPTIITQPIFQSTAAGSTVVLSASVQYTAGAVYQWLKDGAPIPGANSPVYSIPALASSNTGNYALSITTPTGTVTTNGATVGLGAATDPGRLINLSILTSLTGASDNFTFGVVVGGSGTSGGKPLLVRAAGPSLTSLGVTGVLDDPKLEFFTGTAKVGENDDWGGAAATAAAMAGVGAFPFSAPTSRDAAIFLPTLASGANSARISGTGAGTVIAELYDATPSSQFTSTTPRLVNVSVLKHIGSGVTAGFVIGGSSSRTVLVRAVGPTLGAAPFNVPGVVDDPQLALFSGATRIGQNDNWGGTTALTAAFNQVGAFGLPGASKDAALLMSLQPGNYTVQVSGVGGSTGVALVEVYEVP